MIALVVYCTYYRDPGKEGTPIATRAETLEFLKRFKFAINSSNLDLIPRRANLQGITAFGITIRDAKATILALTDRDYCQGPEADQDGSTGEIWVFGVDIGGMQAYIKLKLDNCNAKCLSFHPAQYTMNLPYK